MPWLLDTNVISETWKPRSNPAVLSFLDSCDEEALFISIVTIAELRHGAFTVAETARRGQIVDWIDTMVRPRFSGRILKLSESVLVRWIWLVQDGRRRQRTYSQPDLFFAATALEHDLTLVTRNTRDFADITSLSLLNPWEPQP